MHGEEGHVGIGGKVAEVPQGLAASIQGGGRGLLCKGGARRALLGGAVVRLMSNDTPSPASAPYRRSGRFTNNMVGATGLVVEDITTCDHPPSNHDGSNINITDIPNSPIEVSKPVLRQPRLSRTSKRRKNGNWTNEELAVAIATYDNSMSMKKASEQFCIPYSSFREHCYGL